MNGFAVVLIFLTIGGGLGAIAASIVGFRRGGMAEWAAVGAIGACVLIVGLLIGWMASSPGIADGCWKVASHTSTGTGTVFVNGKPGVGVITTSGRDYIPIACPE